MDDEFGPLKLLVSGPVGAGKTTFIRTLSETPVVDTDEQASEDIGKAMTTIAFDLGTLTLDGLTLHLWGTPGQDRFDFMWDMAAEGAIGMLLLVAGDQPRHFMQARTILEYITSRHPVPFIVGVTRQDIPDVWSPEDVAGFFELPITQVVGLNATDIDSAAGALVQLMELLLGDAIEDAA